VEEEEPGADPVAADQGKDLPVKVKRFTEKK
jgi:hypothetical protein